MGKMGKNKSAAALAVLSVALAAGCSGQSGGSGSGDKGPAGGDKSAKPLELKIHYHQGDARPFKDDWPVFVKAAELTGVTLKGTAPQSATNSKEVFNIMMASGQLPDIISGDRDQMLKAASDGALMPLDELIDKHAPNIRKFLQANDWVRKGAVAADGKLYYIPYVQDGQASEGFFLRKDWLDKLGLPAPKTVDDYYNTLKAFREKDPNGNGKKDEVPYFSRNKKGALSLVQLFGARTSWYVQDGQVRYGKAEPEYKTAMNGLARWYKEDLIDKEIFTRGDKAREILLGDNAGGATHDWFASTATYNDSLKDKVPGLQWLPIDPPADVNGKVKEEFSRELLAKKGWGISQSSKHAAEAMAYFDFWHTPEGRRLYNFGLEGQQYTMVNGKAIFKDEIVHGKDPVNKQLWAIGAQTEIGAQMDFFYEEQWMNPIAKEGVKRYIDNNWFVPQFPSLSFTEAEQKVITQKWPAIETFISEKEQKWIIGAEPVEGNFEAYVKALRTMGMDEIAAIYNAAYARYSKS